MILLLVALKQEALPIITHFKLKSIPSLQPYKVYKNEIILLVETGVGSLNAAITTTAMLEKFSVKALLNIGIAGGLEKKIFLAHKISSTESKKSYYPRILFKTPLLSTEVLTHSHVNTAYQKGISFDMEAFGIVTSAKNYLTFEYIHALKIIFDTPLSLLEKNPNVSEPILFSMKEIEETLESLLHFINSTSINHSLDISSFLKKWHFTQVEQFRLQKLLLTLKSLNRLEDFSLLKSSKENLFSHLIKEIEDARYNLHRREN